MYFIINNTHGYIKESNGNKYLILVADDESKDTLKMYEKISKKKIKDLIRLTNKNSDKYDEKYMKSYWFFLKISFRFQTKV